MKIGIDITSAITQGGGIGRYTRELIRALVDLDSDNEYRFFSARQPAVLPVADPVLTAPHVIYRPAPLDERWLYRFWYRLRLPLPVQLVTGKLDLFHSPDFVLPPVSGRIPTLLTVHDLSFVHSPDTFPAQLVSYLNRVVPWSVQRATHVLADSLATKQDLMDVWQVPAEKITVLYCGVHPMFRPITDKDVLTAVRRQYNLGDASYILCVGTVQPRKNYQMLIRAFRPVADQYPHNLIIAGGKGWLYDEMMAEVARQGLNGRVRFIGFVDDADLPALYSGADLLAMPSLYEGFGLPLLEAMACGVPVLSSNASSLPEVVGETAVTLPPHAQEAWSQTLLDLLANPNARQQMVAEGFRQSRQFTWEKSARQLLEIYASF
ncbi:MAG: glycosyltransferase family 4 protein [Ardenticatenaceae bacterium]|nr:glycosyltransferase family 4 protein [Ardenticatenaceae bacterium]MCB9443544.1 glycosyltransferase family 4 protein [Ardenticatenaceae bacterium]